jgi:hypothetical protein
MWSGAIGTSEAGFSGDGGPATSRPTHPEPLDLTVDLSGNRYIADRRCGSAEVNQQGRPSATVAGADYLYSESATAAARRSAELNLPSSVCALDSARESCTSPTPAPSRVRAGQRHPARLRPAAGDRRGIAGPRRELPAAPRRLLMTPMGAGGGPVSATWWWPRPQSQPHPPGVGRRASSGPSWAPAWRAWAPIRCRPPRRSCAAPRGVCLDLSGDIYVVDTANSRVLLVPTIGLVSTAAGNGAPGAGGDGGPAQFAQLNQPTACTVDSTGNLYIADTYNHSIRKVDTTGTIAHRGRKWSCRQRLATKVRPPPPG